MGYGRTARFSARSLWNVVNGMIVPNVAPLGQRASERAALREPTAQRAARPAAVIHSPLERPEMAPALPGASSLPSKEAIS